METWHQQRDWGIQFWGHTWCWSEKWRWCREQDTESSGPLKKPTQNRNKRYDCCRKDRERKRGAQEKNLELLTQAIR